MADNCGESLSHVNSAAALSQFSQCFIYFYVGIDYYSIYVRCICMLHICTVVRARLPLPVITIQTPFCLFFFFC